MCRGSIVTRSISDAAMHIMDLSRSHRSSLDSRAQRRASKKSRLDVQINFFHVPRVLIQILMRIVRGNRLRNEPRSVKVPNRIITIITTPRERVSSSRTLSLACAALARCIRLTSVSGSIFSPARGQERDSTRACDLESGTRRAICSSLLVSYRGKTAARGTRIRQRADPKMLKP